MGSLRTDLSGRLPREASLELSTLEQVWSQSVADTLGAALQTLDHAAAPLREGPPGLPNAVSPHDLASSLERLFVERRETPRRPAEALASVAPLPSDGEAPPPESWGDLLTESGVAGRLLDLSMHNAALLLPRSFEEGTLVLLRLPRNNSTDPLDKAARVVRVVCLDEGRWKVALQFLTPLTFDQAYELGRDLLVSEFR